MAKGRLSKTGLPAGREEVVPIYVYKCKNGHVHEKNQGYDAPVTRLCNRPLCDLVAERVIQLPTIINPGGTGAGRGQGAPPFNPREEGYPEVSPSLDDPKKKKKEADILD